MHARVATLRSAGLVLLAALAACTVGSPGSPALGSPDGTSAVGPTATPPGTASPSMPAATSRPAPSSADGTTPPAESPAAPLPDEPPAAWLAGLAGDQVAGDLGTASWNGLVSDAPWIVGRGRGDASTGTRLEVTFDPAIRPSSWRARWAPIRGHEAGAPRRAAAGTSEPISVTVPETAGAWSLQVEAAFGADASGTWYWAIEVNR